MKVCPICKARCFDDMERCYGCMHLFDVENSKGLRMEGAGIPDQISDPMQEALETMLPLVKKEVTIPLSNNVSPEVVDVKGSLSAVDHQERARPKHAAENDPRYPVEQFAPQFSDNRPMSVSKEGSFRAQYQLVISLEPIATATD